MRNVNWVHSIACQLHMELKHLYRNMCERSLLKCVFLQQKLQLITFSTRVPMWLAIQSFKLRSNNKKEHNLWHCARIGGKRQFMNKLKWKQMHLNRCENEMWNWFRKWNNCFLRMGCDVSASLPRCRPFMFLELYWAFVDLIYTWNRDMTALQIAFILLKWRDRAL